MQHMRASTDWPQPHIACRRSIRYERILIHTATLPALTVSDQALHGAPSLMVASFPVGASVTREGVAGTDSWGLYHARDARGAHRLWLTSLTFSLRG